MNGLITNVNNNPCLIIDTYTKFERKKIPLVGKILISGPGDMNGKNAFRAGNWIYPTFFAQKKRASSIVKFHEDK